MWRRSRRGPNDGANAGPKQPEHIGVMQSLRQDIKKFELRRNHLETKARALKSKAKAQHSKGDKSGALLNLKKMKLWEKEIVKLDSSILTLEQQIIGLESTDINTQIYKAQKLGVEETRRQKGKIKVEQVEQLQDEMEEMRAQLEEVNEIIGGDDLYDEESLLDELEELEDESEELQEEDDEEAFARIFTSPQKQTGTRGRRQRDDFGEDIETLNRLEMSMRGVLDDLEEAPKTPVQGQTAAKKPEGISEEEEDLMAELQAEMLA